MNPFYNKKKKGYTLAEVLATVAILLILMAIAVPAIFSIRKNLRQKALDNKAELIYTAVQNNLVKLQSNGNSSLYDGEKRAKAMGRTPSDATKEQKLYYALSSEKTDTKRAASVLVTTDTVDGELYNNYWVVEYNPESASVYAVFYSESDSIKPYDPNVYDSFRYKDNRLSDGARIGYYGGDALDGSNTAVLAPKITVTNEEKLVATITCMRQGQDDKKLGFDVVLSDDQGNKLNLSYKAVGDKLVHTADDLYLVDQSPADQEKEDSNEESSIVGRSYTLKITLDDLKNEASRFVSIYGKKNQQLVNRGITPLNAGTNLHIKVTVRSDNYKIDGLATECTTNSLFADQSTSNQAVVYYGRHLQNLDLASGVTEGITEAVVKNPVHFEKQEDKEEGDTSSWYSCYGDKAFTPITNTYLKKFSGERTAVIYHLTVKEGVKIADTERKGAGMFSVLNENMTVDSVSLSGTTIQITEGASVSAGALAGETAGSISINDCEVYLDQEDVAGKDESDIWISGADIQGGLIGRTNGSQNAAEAVISNSFAATVMAGGQNSEVGGLVGRADGAIKITKCYADSYLSGRLTGGLVAHVNSSKMVEIESCYTAGYQKPVKQAGGFVAQASAENTSISNGYTAVSYLQDKNSTATPKIYSVGQAAIGGNSHVYYLNKGKNLSDSEADPGEETDYKTLSKKADAAAALGTAFTTSTTTYAYNLRKQGLTNYSYPSLVNVPHYGDWEASYEAGSLVYYEKYATGENCSAEYGFFGGNVKSTLQDDQTVSGDGYGIVYAADEMPAGFIVQYQSGENETDLTSWTVNCKSEETIKYVVKVPGEDGKEEQTYYIFPLSPDVINAPAISGVYYQKLTVEGVSADKLDDKPAAQGITDETADITTEVMSAKTFYYNPHFAKTVETTDKAPDNISTVYLRTARQLYHMSLYYPEYASQFKINTSFTQELDINYKTYDWGNFGGGTTITVQHPIGMAENGELTAFAAAYKGGYHKIYGISFAGNSSAIGFIGENKGSIQNVFLVSDWTSTTFTDDNVVDNPYLSYTGTIGSGRKIYMGTLAGINSGTIQNCAVCGYSMGREGIVYVQRNGSLYMGGLTGSNQGNIFNCEVDAPVLNASVLYGSAYLGGFAGENIGSGLIRNSYAIGNVTIEYSKGATCTISGFTANNTGILRSDYCAVALAATGTPNTYGFAPKAGGVVSSDCYYLSGGTFQYLGDMFSFDSDQGAGSALTYDKMKAKKNDSTAEYHTETGGENYSYPFVAVVSDGNGNKVHYGNWQIPVSLGSIGVIYWEHEVGGANEGYHFSYIGYKPNGENSISALDRVQDSTLCTRHDDGGRITEYGYGYYYSSSSTGGTNKPDMVLPGAEDTSGIGSGFQTGNQNEIASNELTSQLEGVTVIAYTTAPSIDDGSGEFSSVNDSSYMTMTADDRTANGIWQFDYNGQRYTFTINPFFANAMQYGSTNIAPITSPASAQSSAIAVYDEGGVEVSGATSEVMPGASKKEYEIRSADQLQYLNWNCETKNVVTTLNESKHVDHVDGYTYLGYMTGKNAPVSADYNWIQSHDVDANMTSAPDGGNVFFTQIGSMYDENGVKNTSDAQAHMSYFNGNYDGNTYYIKNIEINSKNTVVGLFGNIIGAKVNNVILYSDKGNYIQRRSDSESWHAMGGMCGLAAVGKGKSSDDVKISNCTVSGYTIRDNTTKGAWGDTSIGGMFGMSTMDLSKCTAVNDIVVNTIFSGRMESVRVGGLVGSMRGYITNCYTGGKIICTKECIDNVSKNYQGSRLMLAGISGGIYIKNKGNLLTLLGESILGIKDYKDDTNGNNKKCESPATVIRNCYTYVEMPNDPAYIDKITSIEPIGSNGETHDEKRDNYHVKIEISNCYYYEDNIPKSIQKNYKIKEIWGANSNADWNNIDATAIPLSWAEMAGEVEVDSTIGGEANGQKVQGDFVTLLNTPSNANEVSATFATVTKKENDQNVDGKYSFPGNRTDLEGENYPFPTILTQKTKRGTSVNVHYGAWPLEGIFWRESRATMDIFEDMDLEQTDDSNQPRALKTFYLDSNLVGDDSLGKELTLNNGFTVEYSNGDDKDDTATAAVSQQSDWSDGFSEGVEISDGTETFVSASEAGDNVQTETQTSDQKDYIAQIVKLEYSETEKCYVATVEALKTGTTVITVRATVRKTVDNQEIELEYQASFTLTVTADLTVYSDSAEIKGELHQTSDKITLYAVPTSQALSVKEAGSSGSTAEVGADGFSSDGSGVAIEEDAAQSEESGISMESLEADVDTENLDDVGGFEAGEDYADMVTESEEASSYGSSDFESAPESNSENSVAEYFESDPETASGFEEEISEGQNVQTSGDQKIAVYADTAPSKNFASMMTWTITEDPVGAVTVSEISDNQFTVTIESLVPATLTVKGTYTYKGVEYTSYTWINVIGLESGQTVSTDPSDSETGADWAGSSADSANYSSDAASGWEDQNNDTIDIIPNESPDDFSEDDGSWESGDSGF